MNHRAPGFTLVEFLMVIVITALLMTAVVQTLVTQQRGYRQQTAMVNARQSSRTVLDLLAVELRELSASDGDLLITEPELLRFRAFRKVGTACEIDDFSLKVEVIGDVAFQAEDPLLVYHEEGDFWEVGEVTSTGVGTCNEDPDRPAQVLEVSGLANPVMTDAPIRGFEVLSYGLFNIDQEWVLGRSDNDGNVTALVGPLAQNGLRFAYYRQDATEFTPSCPGSCTDAARIEVVVRGKGLGAGTASGVHIDSLSQQIYLRGN